MLTSMGNETAPGAESTVTSPRRRWLIPAIIAGGGLVIAIIVISIVVSTQAQAAAEAEARAEAAEERREVQRLEDIRLDELEASMTACGVTIDSNNVILDGGEAAELARVSKFDGASLSSLYCVLDKLEAPAALEAKIGQTRALDGRQTDEWENFAISWSYHPDSGASVLIERTDG